jgi:uncharacterized protein YjiS (DUF1127 family)
MNMKRISTAFASGIASSYKALIKRLGERRRRADPRHALIALSDETLRDLGVGRSELTSIWAEHTHMAQPTRLRVVPAAAARSR